LYSKLPVIVDYLLDCWVNRYWEFCI